MSHPSAAELNAVFQTEGAFYNRVIHDEVYSCRSQAKITRRDAIAEHVDAVCVLVNPGSCQPKSDTYVFPSYSNRFNEVPFVPAKTDPTQHQIMRLMERQAWNSVYIVNLSDLRAGKIDDFKESKNNFEASLNDSHSIFSSQRIQELKDLVDENTTVIAGWGAQAFMKTEMLHALEILSAFNPVQGLPHPTHPYYYHPFPMVQHKCIKWLDDICVKLEGDMDVC